MLGLETRNCRHLVQFPNPELDKKASCDQAAASELTMR